ncbi:hypothetical protein LPJ60_005183 [Coemansia sp. RSA 2675]|nr:hypothetical protein LPJ60_005183 [Coemansia sp. RSA 2675]
MSVVETPLPWGQLVPLLAVRLSEPLQYAVVLPFVYKMIEGFHIAESSKDIAFYASLLSSSFAIAQTLTIMYWSRLSDRIGRRPVLLMGLSGNFVSFLLFAVSPTFYIALGARSLNGMLAGNVAVMKSVMAEISDDSNRARVMALLPLVWNVGSVAGSAAGGVLADPAREGGMLEGVRVFRMFPYLLPCLVASCVTLVGLVLGTFVVRETLRKRGAEEGVPILGGRPRRGFRELMTPVVSSVMFNNAMSSLIVSMSDQVYPIFAATGRSDGGLGFDSREIGYSLAISGLAVFYLQLAVYPRMERRYGALGCYRRGLLVLVPYLVAMPWVSMVGRKGVVWPLLVGLLLVKVAGQVLMFTSINLLTVNLAPTREDLGFMNGVQQVAMSATRMLGPLMGGIAWSWSQRMSGYPLNAHFVWILSAVLAGWSLFLARNVPDSVNTFAADQPIDQQTIDD